MSKMPVIDLYSEYFVFKFLSLKKKKRMYTIVYASEYVIQKNNYATK